MEGLNSTSPLGALKQHGERAAHWPQMALGKHRAALHGIWLPTFKVGQFGVMGIAGGKALALPFPLLSFLLPQSSPWLPINNTHRPCLVTETAAAERLNETGKNCFCKFKYLSFNNTNSLPCWSSKAGHWRQCLLPFHRGIERSVAFEQITASSSALLGLVWWAPSSWHWAVGAQTQATTAQPESPPHLDHLLSPQIIKCW